MSLESMFNDVLVNLMEPGHFMWQDGEVGNFSGDWTYDAAAFGPGVLFREGYTTEAIQMMDYNTSIGTALESIVEFAVGFASYIYGPVYYPSIVWVPLMQAGVVAGCTEAKKDPSLLGNLNGYISGMSAIACTSFRMAHVARKKAMYNQGKSVYDLMNANYWDPARGYYYDTDPMHQGSNRFSTFQNGSALWALSWYYGITHELDALSKIESLYDELEIAYWDPVQKMYGDDSAGLLFDLGANLLIVRGLEWCYWTIGETEYLIRAQETLEGLETSMFKPDTAHPGYKILHHDNHAINYCTGCNFLALECIRALWTLQAEGPLGGKIPISCYC